MENSTHANADMTTPDLSNTDHLSFTDRARALLKSKGLRITRDRVLVLADLMKIKNPISHTVLFGKLKNQGLHMDRVTLYRILEWLTDNQLVYRISGEDRTWRFSFRSADAGDNSDVHAHFHCKKCGSYTCLHDLSLRSDLRMPEGFSTTEVELTVTGVCPTCIKQ